MCAASSKERNVGRSSDQLSRMSVQATVSAGTAGGRRLTVPGWSVMGWPAPVSVLEKTEEVLAVARLAQRFGALAQIVVAEEAAPPGDLLGAADLQALPCLDRAHERRGVGEGVERAGVQPGGAARQHLDREPALIEVVPVDVGDLVLAPVRGLQTLGDLDDLVVVEVQAGHRVGTLRPLRLLLQRQGTLVVV